MVNPKFFAQNTPIYSMQSPNQPITLYQGSMEILYKQQEKAVQGTGVLNLTWLPSPRMTFEMEVTSEDFAVTKIQFTEMGRFIPFAKKEITPEGTSQLKIEIIENYSEIKLLDTGLNLKTDHIKWNNQKAIGVVSSFEHISDKADESLIFVFFNLVNFYDPNNKDIILKSSEWQITIQPIKDFSNLVKDLEAFGGYAITHAAKLERIDGKQFSPTEATELLEALLYFLSFVRGIWSGVILPIGINKEGSQVWRGQILTKTDSWREAVRSGSSSEYAQRFYENFPGFINKWKLEGYKEALRIAIDWYIQGNNRGVNVEGSIILAQSGLELLCSIMLDEWTQKELLKKYGKKKIEDVSFPAKIEELLAQLKVSMDVPVELGTGALRETVETLESRDKKKWTAPSTLANLRNKLTHPDHKNRKGLFDTFKGTQLRGEALNLSLWYIEILLLNFFGYREDDLREFVIFFKHDIQA
jgi:hypothetical protein